MTLRFEVQEDLRADVINLLPDMRAGDLMFFYGSGGVYHAGIFLRWSKGHALMLHSPGSGQRVRISAPWTSQWFGGTLRRR